MTQLDDEVARAASRLAMADKLLNDLAREYPVMAATLIAESTEKLRKRLEQIKQEMRK